MPIRPGLGPVFVYESLVNSRRWQIYAGRSIFVLVLLLGLLLVWTSTVHDTHSWSLIQALSQVGEQFFYTIATIQLFLVLLAAPGATAGAICLDRARGTLTHMLCTDLSDSEIVLGKLAARLAPVFGLVLCGWPVMAMATMLGGIDPDALLGSLFVSLAIAVLGCSLALALSVRATKAHEVLMVVYMFWAAWLLAIPFWQLLQAVFGTTGIPDWFWKANPFVLVYAPYTHPGYTGFYDFAVFIAVALSISAALIGWTILRLRRSFASHEERTLKRPRRFLAWFRPLAWLPGPSLDFNPILWRECRRSRASKLTRFVWGVYVLASVTATALVFRQLATKPFNMWSDSVALCAGLEIAFGFLFVSAQAPTALTEEKVRGSLDVLLATPLTTRAIVLAKWWGAYRVVPLLAILPTLSMTVLAIFAPTVTRNSLGASVVGVPITILDRLFVVFCSCAQVLLQGAAIVSLGLALATWCKRPARAIAANVTVLVLIAIGWPFLAELGAFELFGRYDGNDPMRQYVLMMGSLALSPLVGPETLCTALEMSLTADRRADLWLFELTWLLLAALAAGGLLAATVLTFNRCLGRVEENTSRRPGIRPRMTRTERRLREKHQLANAR